MPTREHVLFDFDHTIIRHDAFMRFAEHQVAREPWRLPLALSSVALTWPGLYARKTHHAALSAMLWSVTVGMDQHELERRMTAFVARDELGDWLHPAAKAAIAEHRERGQRVVVVTGCEQSLARRLCDRFELGDVRVVGTRLEALARGFGVAMHCVAGRKLKCLASAGFTPPFVHAYSDSALDLPILRAASRVTLVNPSPRSRARVLAELRERTEVVSW